MPSLSTLARRRPSIRRAPSDCPPVEPPPSATPHPPVLDPELSRPPSIRFYLVWAARLLLPIVYLLSNATLVTIPPAPSPSPSQPNEAPSPPHPHLSIPSSSAVLVITHARDVYLARCLHSLVARHPGGPDWPILVSRDQQDGEHPLIDAVVASYADIAAARNITLISWPHAKSYDDSKDASATTTSNTAAPAVAASDARSADPQSSPLRFIDTRAYRRISRHYRVALDRALRRRGVERVVIVEDDMEVAPDFYNYFAALAPLLQADPTLLCVSAWNDNGVAALVRNASQLHRTDFFPGLGWMLTRALWDELRPKWPAMFWDDWMRADNQTRGRQCVRPEVSRTANFGRRGVSQSFHYDKHVSRVVLSTADVDFAALDLSYLEAARYHHLFFSRMSRAVRLRYSNYLTSRPQDADVIAFYPDDKLHAIGKRTGIMTDHRDGVRRTSYKGVIVFPWREHWAFVVQNGWQPPDGYQLGESECC